MEKKNIDWGNLGFAYTETDKRFVSYYKDGSWDEGALIDDATVTMSECACVLQYAQTCFEDGNRPMQLPKKKSINSVN